MIAELKTNAEQMKLTAMPNFAEIKSKNNAKSIDFSGNFANNAKFADSSTMNHVIKGVTIQESGDADWLKVRKHRPRSSIR